MNRIKNKKFGRSGCFKRKQKRLVEEIVKKNVSVESEIQCARLISFQIENVEMNECRDDENTDNNTMIIDNEADRGNDKCNKDERNFPFDKVKFQSALAMWAVNNNIKHEQLRGLLKIWNEHVPLSALPVDPRTILETPRSVVIKDNNYWYRGIKCVLHEMLQKTHSINMLTDVSLKINSDGITILKSSGMECWPILIQIAEFPNISPEVVSLYCGKGKPNNLELYLRDFVEELKDCIANGIIVDGHQLNVKVNCFIADSPARALLKSRFI